MATTTELSSREIQGLCQRYLKEDYTHIEKDNKRSLDNFRVVDFKLKPVSEAPAGYLGSHQFLTVQIAIQNDNNEEKQLEVIFFTKSAPFEVESRMKYVEDFGVFKKEIIVYREILPKLQEIIRSIAPKCYYAGGNILVFENLAQQGYRMGAARDGLLNYEHLKCAIKTLAALHASSLVMEAREGKPMLEMYSTALVENAYPPKATNRDNFRVKNFYRAIIVFGEMIKTLPKYQKDLELIVQELPKRLDLIFELSKPSKKYKNVLSHGDLWANNIMFQYGKFGETPLQCRLVDFQLARYAPPMMDLITVLTIPTSRAFRETHLVELFEEYYRCMSDFLKLHALSMADILPREQFFAGMEEFRIIGLIESCLFSHLTILPEELTQELTCSEDGFSDFFEKKRTEFCMKAFHSDKVYHDRMVDMLEDLIDNHILEQK